MNAVIRAAAELQDVCEAHGWRYCFIGGLAVLRWGEPRETVAVDLTVLTGFVNEARYVSALLAQFEPRIDDAADFARVNRVLLLRAASGVGLDIALGGLPFEEAAVGDPACSPSRPMSGTSSPRGIACATMARCHHIRRLLRPA